MKRLFSILLVVFALCIGTVAFAADDTLEVSIVPIDTTNDYMLVTNNFNHGLALVDNQSGKSVTITDGRNAGYYARISPDQNYVCYKEFLAEGDSYLQKPMLYNIKTGRTVGLTNWSPLAGTPAVALNGTIAYSVGNELVLLDAKFNQVKSVNLGYHVNLFDFSKDSQKIAFNNAEGQVVVMNVNGMGMRVVSSTNMLWGPKFSPNGDKIMAPTIDGQTALIDATTFEIKAMEKGQALGWVDNNTIACLDKEVNEKDGKVLKSKMVLLNTMNLSKDVVDINSGDADVAIKGQNIAITRNGALELGQVRGKSLNTWKNSGNIPVPAKAYITGLYTAQLAKERSQKLSDQPGTGDVTIKAIDDTSTYRNLTGMPYIHQVYDTPNSFDGNWACNATSALMAIQYWGDGVLAPHPITCSYPSTHTSNFGWYICNVYTKGRTFNIYSNDPDGQAWAGGYGYITQNGWEDTKGHMAEYIRYHGWSSSVDWSPTWAELKTQIDSNNPVIFLTSLTSSGHYVVGKGYYFNQHTTITHDPYGNKNQGYKNYNGDNARYDWPGYNNGYSNLNTVHCFVYCKN